MKIITMNKENSNKIKLYWNKISKGVPYFYPVSLSRLNYSLFEDEKYGERIFNHLESYLIEEEDEVLGFIQFGKPHIYWDTNGQKCYDPNIGVVRNIYFNEDRFDVGRILINRAKEYFDNNNFDNCFAFNHVLGMSCCAYHGKLHESRAYIAKLLNEYGYDIEHENVYYSIELNDAEDVEDELTLAKSGINKHCKEKFELIYQGEKIGESVVLCLDNIKTVYMNTIWIDSKYSNKGFGAKFIKLICNNLFDNGYIRLDLDTAKNNLGAQRFYERNGFCNRGITRSYSK